MSLNDKLVHQIASLAKLNIPANEVETYKQELNNIFELVEKMKACDTANIEPMTHPLDATLMMRKDTITESNQREQFQQLAPESEQGLYIVPKVID